MHDMRSIPSAFRHNAVVVGGISKHRLRSACVLPVDLVSALNFAALFI